MALKDLRSFPFVSMVASPSTSSLSPRRDIHPKPQINIRTEKGTNTAHGCRLVGHLSLFHDKSTKSTIRQWFAGVCTCTGERRDQVLHLILTALHDYTLSNSYPKSRQSFCVQHPSIQDPPVPTPSHSPFILSPISCGFFYLFLFLFLLPLVEP